MLNTFTNHYVILSYFFQSHDGGSNQYQRPSRHKSPTTSLNRTTDLEDSNQYVLDDSANVGEADVSDFCYPHSYLSNGSSELKHEDEGDGLNPKTNAIIEHLGNKIIRVRDLIRTEQKMRDGK